MNAWLKPPKLFYLLIGLPLIAAALGYILDLLNLVNFPGLAGD